MTTLIPKFDLKDGGATPTGAINRPINEKLAEMVSVKDFGAVGDGTTDDSTAIQDAVNAVGSGTLYFPAGTYKVNSTITLNDGMILQGAGQVVVNINCPAGVNLFDWNPTGSNDRRGFHIWDMTLESDLCIQINRTANLVQNGAGDSAFVGGSIKRCRFYNVTANTGNAIVASKMFDTVISENQFAGSSTFSKTIVLNGCDLNTIENNRFSGFQNYGIIDASAQSFGSSNRICHNDMTLQTNTSAKFILSTSHYIIIEDNYLEQIGAGTGSAVGIDCNADGGISFGSNVQDSPYSIYIVNNRIEPEANFGACIRIDPTKATTIVCKNPTSTVAVGLSYFTPTGNYLTFGVNNFSSTYIEIAGASWGVWDGYKSNGNVQSNGTTFTVDGTNALSFPYTVQGNYNSSCSFQGKNIVLTSPLVAGNRVVVTPSLSTNLYFPATTITLTIIARTTSGSGDTLTTSYIDSTNGPTSIVSCSLTQQFQKFTGTFTGYGIGFTNAGIQLNRATTNGDIQIASVSWSY